jgi:hypothetical protein
LEFSSDSEYENEDLPELVEVSDSDSDSGEPSKEEDWRDIKDTTNKSTDILGNGEEEEIQETTTYDGLFSSLVVFLLDNRYSVLFPDTSIDWNDDILIFPSTITRYLEEIKDLPFKVYSTYKRVAQKIHPVSGTFPEEARVCRSIPRNPLDSLPLLSSAPPEFVPTERLTAE